MDASIKLKALEIIDYSISLKDLHLTFTLVNSRLWLLLESLVKWAIKEKKSKKIQNVFKAQTKEEKKAVISFCNQLITLAHKWGELYPITEDNNESRFKALKDLIDKDNINYNEVENPYEAKKIVYQPIFLDFDESIRAEAYFMMVLASYDEIRGQLRKSISTNPINERKMNELLKNLNTVKNATSNDTKMTEYLIAGGNDIMVARIIELNTEIEELKRVYSNSCGDSTLMQKLRENEGVVVFSSGSHSNREFSEFIRLDDLSGISNLQSNRESNNAGGNSGFQSKPSLKGISIQNKSNPDGEFRFDLEDEVLKDPRVPRLEFNLKENNNQIKKEIIKEDESENKSMDQYYFQGLDDEDEIESESVIPLSLQNQKDIPKQTSKDDNFTFSRDKGGVNSPHFFASIPKSKSTLQHDGELKPTLKIRSSNIIGPKVHFPGEITMKPKAETSLKNSSSVLLEERNRLLTKIQRLEEAVEIEKEKLLKQNNEKLSPQTLQNEVNHRFDAKKTEILATFQTNEALRNLASSRKESIRMKAIKRLELKNEIIKLTRECDSLRSNNSTLRGVLEEKLLKYHEELVSKENIHDGSDDFISRIADGMIPHSPVMLSNYIRTVNVPLNPSIFPKEIFPASPPYPKTRTRFKYAILSQSSIIFSSETLTVALSSISSPPTLWLTSGCHAVSSLSLSVPSYSSSALPVLPSHSWPVRVPLPYPVSVPHSGISASALFPVLCVSSPSSIDKFPLPILSLSLYSKKGRFKGPATVRIVGPVVKADCELLGPTPEAREVMGTAWKVRALQNQQQQPTTSWRAEDQWEIAKVEVSAWEEEGRWYAQVVVECGEEGVELGKSTVQELSGIIKE